MIYRIRLSDDIRPFGCGCRFVVPVRKRGKMVTLFEPSTATRARVPVALWADLKRNATTYRPSRTAVRRMFRGRTLPKGITAARIVDAATAESEVA